MFRRTYIYLTRVTNEPVFFPIGNGLISFPIDKMHKPDTNKPYRNVTTEVNEMNINMDQVTKLRLSCYLVLQFRDMTYMSLVVHMSSTGEECHLVSDHRPLEYLFNDFSSGYHWRSINVRYYWLFLKELIRWTVDSPLKAAVMRKHFCAMTSSCTA